MSGTIPQISGSGDHRKYFHISIVFIIILLLGKNTRHDSQEPLKRFTDAKMQMRDIYNNLEECVHDLAKFYEG